MNTESSSLTRKETMEMPPDAPSACQYCQAPKGLFNPNDVDIIDSSLQWIAWVPKNSGFRIITVNTSEHMSFGSIDPATWDEFDILLNRIMEKFKLEKGRIVIPFNRVQDKPHVNHLHAFIVTFIRPNA